MAKALVDFSNFDGKLGSSDFSPVPNGTYEVEVDTSKSEVKSGTSGDFIPVVFRVINNAEYNGRLVFENLFISGKAVWKMGNFLVAVGKLDKDNPHNLEINSDEWHGLQLRIRVATEQNDPNFAPKNVVKAYLPLEGATPAVGAPAQTKKPGRKAPF